MIYELIPQTTDELDSYLTTETGIKILITFFYSVDYLLLFGDMNETIKTENRSWCYILCDVFSSLFFFFAFVSVKIGHDEFGLLFMSLIPVLFFTYKRKNRNDKKVHIWYAILSSLIGIFFFINYSSKWIHEINYQKLLFWFVLVSLVIYITYVFWYYEKFSKNKQKNQITSRQH
jgi:cbb3-type cytochrome oxidase subunit 3